MTADTALRPLRQSYDVMGTRASLVLVESTSADEPALASIAAGIRRRLTTVDHQFSPFRDTSELSRLRGGPVQPASVSSEMRTVMATCQQIQERTRGHFRPYDPEGHFDPSAYVKGWAVERATQQALADGASNVCLNVGGDIRLSGRPHPDRGWHVAVRSPADPNRIAAILKVPDDQRALAVATSGFYERGDHIWRSDGTPAGKGRVPAELGQASVTVVGPDLGLADAYSTAAWSALSSAGPTAALELFEHLPGFDALMLLGGQLPEGTTGMARYLI